MRVKGLVFDYLEEAYQAYGVDFSLPGQHKRLRLSSERYTDTYFIDDEPVVKVDYAFITTAELKLDNKVIIAINKLF